LEDIGCYEEILETADTIEGNSVLKANYVTEKYGYDCFADDTGLEVEALNGAPGVFSARYAGEQRSAADNMDKLLQSYLINPIEMPNSKR
jgi:XTP/dITP diphosphohydrolase